MSLPLNLRRLSTAWRSGRWLRGCWLLLLGWLMAGGAQALSECSVPQDGLSLVPSMAVLPDPAQVWNVNEARRRYAQGEFEAVRAADQSFGFVPGVLWVRVELPPVDVTCYTLLVLEQSRIAYVEIFDPASQGWRSAQVMGAAVPYTDRAVPHRFPNLRLLRTPSESLELFLKLRSTASVQLPLTLHTDATLYQQSYREQAGMGLFYGVLLALLLYNLSVLAGVRDITYVHAVSYLLAIGLFTLVFMGHGAQLLGPWFAALQDWAVPGSITVLLASALVFVRSFLGLQQAWPAMYRAFQGLMWAVGVSGLLCLGWPQSALKLQIVITLVTAVLITVSGVREARRGSRPALVFVASWAALVVCTSLISASSMGWLPRTRLSEYALQAGLAAQMVVLSFALVYRINLLQIERQVALRDAERAASRAQMQAQLQRSLDERNTVLENSMVAILFLNGEGRVVWANGALYRLFAVTPQALMAAESLARYFMDEPAFLAVAQTVRECVRQGQAYEAEFPMRRADGSSFWAYVSGRAVSPQDPSRGTVWTVVDLSQRKQAEDEIRTSLAQQQELNYLKSNFVAMASHEFRTPLASILSSAQIIQHYHDRLPAEDREATLASIEAAVARMTRLLDDVLLLGRADAHRLEFNPQPLDLLPWAQSLLDEARLSASDTHHLLLQAPGGLPSLVLDEKLLRHILSNLLSNAVKYSPEGGEVVLTLAWSPGPAGQSGQLELQVRDTGIGLKPEDLPRLFETFYRASNVGTIVGTGLGLAIVMRSVQLHGGQITVDSELGRGTCFRVSLPAAASGPGLPP